MAAAAGRKARRTAAPRGAVSTEKQRKAGDNAAGLRTWASPSQAVTMMFEGHVLAASFPSLHGSRRLSEQLAREMNHTRSAGTDAPFVAFLASHIAAEEWIRLAAVGPR